MIRSTKLWIILFGLAMLSSCAAPPAPTPGVTDVTMPGLFYSPNVVTIKAGDSVRWTNTETLPVPHTVTSGNPGDPNAGSIFDSNSIFPGQSFTFTFNTPGTYVYFCKFHFMEGMQGAQVIVTP
jgi:plastocyanin